MIFHNGIVAFIQSEYRIDNQQQPTVLKDETII